jgi:hypothetical protein
MYSEGRHCNNPYAFDQQNVWVYAAAIKLGQYSTILLNDHHDMTLSIQSVAAPNQASSDAISCTSKNDRSL